MRLVTIVGARPQFVKAAIVSRALGALANVDECIVHTGQHYDERMSALFFEELEIPRPKYYLHAGSGSHGKQTGVMLDRVEGVLFEERPDAVLVYGDTNSTLAGALAAAKLHIPVVHVEAGLRSFDMRMPEEVNRILTDRLSRLLLCPTSEAVEHLRREGIVSGVHLVGDVMYDAAMHFAEQADRFVRPVEQMELTSGGYVLLTCHRAENTDDASRFESIMRAAERIGETLPVVFPVHPRVREIVEQRFFRKRHVRCVHPLTYMEMLSLERDAAAIVTDSGGVQKEAFFFGVPCVTMRDSTEWLETIDAGANVLVGADEEKIVRSVRDRLGRDRAIRSAEAVYGGGQAASNTARLIAQLASGNPSAGGL